MLRDVLKLLSLLVLLVTNSAWAADRADEYPGFPRLTDNYEVGSRRQNYDEVKLPIGINKKQAVEGDKTIINYTYRKHDVTASRLQFQRHFEAIARKLGGEVVFMGKTEDVSYAFTFRYPRNGKTAWALAQTQSSPDDIRYYSLEIVETGEAWGGAAPAPAPTPVVVPAPAPVLAPVVTPSVIPAPAPSVWKGGEWQTADYDGCDGYDLKTHKNPEPLTEFCDQDMAGKVAVCRLEGCVYKRATPKQCKGGSRPGRMYVCTPY